MCDINDSILRKLLTTTTTTKHGHIIDDTAGETRFLELCNYENTFSVIF